MLPCATLQISQSVQDFHRTFCIFLVTIARVYFQAAIFVEFSVKIKQFYVGLSKLNNYLEIFHIPHCLVH